MDNKCYAITGKGSRELNILMIYVSHVKDAINHGYKVIRIHQPSLKEGKILTGYILQLLRDRNIPMIIYIPDNGLYNAHKKLMKGNDSGCIIN